MALNNIKRQLTEERIKAEEERKKAQERNRIHEQNRREAREQLKSVLPYLIQLEGYFWECVSDFAQLSHRPIKSRNRSLLYPLVSTPTLNSPVLSVNFENAEKNSIYLRADDKLYFYAHLTHYVSRYSSDSGIIASVSSSFPVHNFNIQAARDWLELQFESYYRQLESL